MAIAAIKIWPSSMKTALTLTTVVEQEVRLLDICL